MRNLVRRLEHEEPGVSGSILEGLDEILTVIRLGLPHELRRSLACTNIVENALGTVRQVTRNVKRWRHAEMALRLTAAGTRVSSLSLARYRTNDYSVPVAYGHREVWIRGYVHEVVIGCGGGIIARHPRSYERDDMVFDPIHYLPLLEQKIAALDQAAPLAGWELPGAFPALRRLLEARMGKSGKREYVQVLRLLETFDLEALHGAVKDALRLGAIGYDAVKHLVLCRIERRPPKLDLDAYPCLPRANVATTAAASYMSLLGGGAS